MLSTRSNIFIDIVVNNNIVMKLCTKFGRMMLSDFIRIDGGSRVSLVSEIQPTSTDTYSYSSSI